MPLKINPTTGKPDLIEGQVFPTATDEPLNQENGTVVIVKTGTKGLLYWFVGGKRYFAEGTEV